MKKIPTERRDAAVRVLALLLFSLILFFETPEGLDPRGHRVLAVCALMATLWISGVMPLAITSLLPVALYPLLGVMSSDATAALYANDMILLFFGGFFLGLTMQKWNLHRRLALIVVSFFGTRPAAMMLGVMFAVALLSMWISNTASTLMMLPICIAITQQVKEEAGVDARTAQRFAIALLLGTAYAANVGGMATPIGTPTNGIFLRQEIHGGEPPSFAEWMFVGLPVSMTFILVIWLLMTRVLFRFPSGTSLGDRDLIRQKLREMGPMSREEKAVLAVFVTTVALWIFRRDIAIGSFVVPGWVSGLRALGLDWLAAGARDGVGDSAAAILASAALCLIRVRRNGEPLASWEMARDIPWGVLLLLGGGFALAAGFRVPAEGDLASLSVWLGRRLESAADLPAIPLIGLTAFLMTFMTEVTSNTATASVTLPILGTIGTGHTPYLLSLAATFSASCAFMLPVATPPNAIVFGSGKLRILDMVRAGIVINLVGVVIVTAGVWTLGRWFLVR